MNLSREDYVEPRCICDNDMYLKEPPVHPIDLSRVLLKLDELYEAKDYKSAVRLILYWIEEARLGRDKRSEFTLLNELMGSYRKDGNEDKAFETSFKAIQMMNELDIADSPSGSLALLNTGTVNLAFGKYKEALDYYNKTKEVFDKYLESDDERYDGLYHNMAMAMTLGGIGTVKKGLDIAREYYEECGKAVLEEEFSDILDKLAIGLCGSGSECYGFDDDISKDHDFEPGFCIWIPGEDVIDRQTAFRLERAYAKLPKEFKGLKRPLTSPVGGQRHGVLRIDDYLLSKIGGSIPMDIYQWMSIPSYALCEAINGEIFADNYGEVTKIREYLSNMPEDARLKRLAGNLLLMAQSGQYNYERCINHGEKAAATLALNQFVQSALECIYLLNKTYMPYYKWSFRGLDKLEKLKELKEPLEYLLLGDSEDTNGKAFTIGEICNAIQNELRNQNITKMNCDDMEKHAYSVNDFIEDAKIRNLGVLYAV